MGNCTRGLCTQPTPRRCIPLTQPIVVQETPKGEKCRLSTSWIMTRDLMNSYKQWLRCISLDQNQSLRLRCIWSEFRFPTLRVENDLVNIFAQPSFRDDVFLHPSQSLRLRCIRAWESFAHQWQSSRTVYGMTRPLSRLRATNA